ncbi:MAG: cellulose biosynthesis cyclic di-GMP-binding regulatory protein BcsB [Natronohydrobacter sp.]|nr:cellulose biosynthesis cyclic di-GMP-binding regulatory protein BcsB [Natronohydrobacter sp.]
MSRTNLKQQTGPAMPRAHARRAGAALMGCVLAFVMQTIPTMAQTVSDSLIPLPEVTALDLPDSVSPVDLSERFDPARRIVADIEANDPDRQLWISPLRLLDLGYPMRNSVTRISGEREWVDFDVYASAAADQQILRLSTVSGINNLPERSYLRVSLNGTDLGRRNLVHVESFGAIDFVLPPDLLLPGRNQVQIELRQHHRIYCGPEASFDLWTDIDLAKSGLVIHRDFESVGVETFLMGLAAQATGVRPVEIRGLENLGSEADTWRQFLVGRLNQVLSGAPVVFRFEDYWTAESAGPAHARITIMPAAQSRMRFVIGGDGAIVMVLDVAQGTRPEDLLAAIPQFDRRYQNIRAPLVMPEHATTFADLGAQTEEFSQHYATRNHFFRLPNDWLVLTAAKARIQLDYAFAANLPEGAMLLLSVNGTSIRLLPLWRGGGAQIEAFPIDFEARLMHPGTNVLTFQMFVPGNPADLPCPSGESPVLQISETSTLHVPYSPSMVIPDMDLAFATLGADSLRKNELSARAYSEMDILTLSAALSRSREAEYPSILHLIAIDDLASIPTGHHRADRRLLENTVLSRPEEALLLAQNAATTPQDPFMARRPSSQPVAAMLNAGWTEVVGKAQWLRDRVFPHSGDQLNAWLAEQQGHAVLFQLDPDRPSEIWMLRSPESDIHTIALAIASARAFGGGPKGQVSVLTQEGHWNNWFAPDRQPILLEPWSRQNFRAAMGNFVSARPIFYTILMLGIALLSALVALRLVISTREHKT